MHSFIKSCFLLIALIALNLTNSSGRTTGDHDGSTGNPLRLSLREAIDFAVEYNTVMKTARTDVEIAGKRIREITATGLPQVDATIGYQYYFNIPTSLVPAEFFGGQPGEFAEIQFGTEQTLNASATLSQLLFDGSYIVGLRAARIYRELAIQNRERTELNVRNRVSETYFLVLLSSDNINLLKLNLANLEQNLAETEKIVEAGFSDPINADQLKLTVSNMKNNLTNLERQYELSINLLKFQAGIELDRQIELTDSLRHLFDRMMAEADPEEEFRYQDHIDYRIMISRQNMDLMNLRREQSFYLPRLTASYTYMEMAMRNKFNFTDSSRPWFPSSFIAINLTVPVFSGGFRSARVSQAQLELNKSQMATEQISESLRLQIEEARSKFKTAIERYKTERENLELAGQILKRITIMHKEGMAGSLELTQANDQLITTRANYYNAMFEFITARNNLEMARGL